MIKKESTSFEHDYFEINNPSNSTRRSKLDFNEEIEETLNGT